MKSLSAKTALVTGGASGIGLAFAKACIANGMQVLVLDRDDIKLGEILKDPLLKDKPVKILQCDITNDADLARAEKFAREEFGSINLLINNAGVFSKGGVGNLSLADWRRVIDINVLGAIACVETFLSHLRENSGDAHIVNVASVAGHAGFSGLAAYCTTKHALVGYTESLHHELKPQGIGVSALCPGFVNTDILTNQISGSGNDVELQKAISHGMSADTVAAFALEQVMRGALYIFTHPGTETEVMERTPLLQSAFTLTRSSDLINGEPDAQRQASRKNTEHLQN